MPFLLADWCLQCLREIERSGDYQPLIRGAHSLDDPSELSSLLSSDLCPSSRSGSEWAGTTCGGGRSPLGLTDLILSRSEILSLETKEVGLWEPERRPRPPWSPSKDSFSLSSVYVTSGILG